MPKAAQVPCREPQCGKPCAGPYCAAHKRSATLAYDQRRGSASKRGYGRRWARLRLMVLARDPLCRIAILCNGMTPSTDADHIVPRSRGGDDTMENLQGACHACHSYKTATSDSGFAKRKG